MYLVFKKKYSRDLRGGGGSYIYILKQYVSN